MGRVKDNSGGRGWGKVAQASAEEWENRDEGDVRMPRSSSRIASDPSDKVPRRDGAKPLLKVDLQ